MRKTLYTVEQFEDAVKTSVSMAQVLAKLGLFPAGGNYANAKRKALALGLDISHLIGSRGRGWSKGKKLPPKRPLEDYLSNKARATSHSLKLRLIKEGIFKEECSNCKLITWLGGPVPLELDHINGNHEDNTLSNLRILCPNCHSLTPTHRGKNYTGMLPTGKELDPNNPTNNPTNVINTNTHIKLLRLRPEGPNPVFICPSCKGPKNRVSEKCRKCASYIRPSKIEWPSVEELLNMLEAGTFRDVAFHLGVSDSAVRKYLRKKGVSEDLIRRHKNKAGQNRTGSS